jgi:pimeloyl-ACP methyl ester carboxylesterase
MPLYSPALAAGLPQAIHDAAQGRYEGLLTLAGAVSAKRGNALAMGMHFSVVCAEDLPRLGSSRDAAGADFGGEQRKLYERVCASWPRGEVPAAFYSVPPSPVPVLLSSGGLDPVTPPRHGERVARALGPKALHVVVPNAGHGVMGIGCMRDVMFRFFDAADDAAALSVDTACVKSIPRPAAFAPVTLEKAP